MALLKVDGMALDDLLNEVACTGQHVRLQSGGQVQKQDRGSSVTQYSGLVGQDKAAELSLVVNSVRAIWLANRVRCTARAQAPERWKWNLLIRSPPHHPQRPYS